MKPARVVDDGLLVACRRQPCMVCKKPGPSDPSHIRSRGAGGPDTSWNVVPMCRDCHNCWHRAGWQRFVTKYPSFAWKLKALGWDLQGEKLWHPGLRSEPTNQGEEANGK